MAAYQLHFFKQGRVVHTHDFDAKSDAGAVKFASVWIEGQAAELCCGDRLVKRWLAKA